MNSTASNVNGKSASHSRLNSFADEFHKFFREFRESVEILQHWMPDVAPHLESFDIAAKAHPCGIVNGDYHDFLRFPDDRLGVTVGDAVGKGMPAALLISSLHARVHALFENPRSLARSMARLNRATCETCPPNRFITFFVAILNSSGNFVYANAGHNPPLIVRASGEFEVLPMAGIVLGVNPNETYPEGRASLKAGDVLVIFSDGVTEASDSSGEPFGEERLGRLVASQRGLAARQIVEAIHSEVAAFTNGSEPVDDVTIVVIRRADTAAVMSGASIQTR
jgi:sigma-B regulation protein RsbU (phosphoserine phosphatase)